MAASVRGGASELEVPFVVSAVFSSCGETLPLFADTACDCVLTCCLSLSISRCCAAIWLCCSAIAFCCSAIDFCCSVIASRRFLSSLIIVDCPGSAFCAPVWPAIMLEMIPITHSACSNRIRSVFLHLSFLCRLNPHNQSFPSECVKNATKLPGCPGLCSGNYQLAEP